MCVCVRTGMRVCVNVAVTQNGQKAKQLKPCRDDNKKQLSQVQETLKHPVHGFQLRLQAWVGVPN